MKQEKSADFPYHNNHVFLMVGRRSTYATYVGRFRSSASWKLQDEAKNCPILIVKNSDDFVTLYEDLVAGGNPSSLMVLFRR